MIIDTIFICFCEDCEKNDGINRPYFMSRGLMVINFYFQFEFLFFLYYIIFLFAIFISIYFYFRNLLKIAKKHFNMRTIMLLSHKDSIALQKFIKHLGNARIFRFTMAIKHTKISGEWTSITLILNISFSHRHQRIFQKWTKCFSFLFLITSTVLQERMIYNLCYKFVQN